MVDVKSNKRGDLDRRRTPMRINVRFDSHRLLSPTLIVESTPPSCFASRSPPTAEEASGERMFVLSFLQFNVLKVTESEAPDSLTAFTTCCIPVIPSLLGGLGWHHCHPTAVDDSPYNHQQLSIHVPSIAANPSTSLPRPIVQPQRSLQRSTARESTPSGCTTSTLEDCGTGRALGPYYEPSVRCVVQGYPPTVFANSTLVRTSLELNSCKVCEKSFGRPQGRESHIHDPRRGTSPDARHHHSEELVEPLSTFSTLQLGGFALTNTRPKHHIGCLPDFWMAWTHGVTDTSCSLVLTPSPEPGHPPILRPSLRDMLMPDLQLPSASTGSLPKRTLFDSSCGTHEEAEHPSRTFLNSCMTERVDTLHHPQ
ncbi:hypothetical protein NMY22_g8943 [Coprinellus aureogranulatus]|nr:hypothetical protein NMY22_g8943 [Coprinellus aureogranulatus]